MLSYLRKIFRITPVIRVDLSAITPTQWIRSEDPLGIRRIQTPTTIEIEGWYQANPMVRDMLTHVIRTGNYKGVKLPPINWRGRP